MSTQEQAFKLRRSFEHVQDYLGVSAQQLWRQEFGRVVRYLLHMEQHLLLRRRPPPPESSPHHDPSVPIKFPDKQSSPQGGSFITRTLSMLLELTDPKMTTGRIPKSAADQNSQNNCRVNSKDNCCFISARDPTICVPFMP